MTIELKALFVEGLYRKSAAVAQVRYIRRKIETTPGKFFEFLFWKVKNGQRFLPAVPAHSRFVNVILELCSLGS